MKARKLLLISFFASLLAASSGPVRAETPVRFAYDVNFDFNFDNREYYKSDFSSSMTIFGARLTPSVGIEVEGGHKIMAGVDVMKDFGSGATVASQNDDGLFHELTLYYRCDRKFGKTGMTLYAGVFPRRMTDGAYSRAFFSDSLKFYDNNLEGLLLKFVRPQARFELGCDWMGKFGEGRRERFMVYSSGRGNLTPTLSLGYSAYMYHFAGSVEVSGVVDNILVNPYVGFEFGHLWGLQTVSARIGWLQGFQNDRKHVGHYVFPCGAELDVEVKHWSLGVRNSLYYGTDMMPYYNCLDSGGYKYGGSLYPGDPFYRVHDDGTAGPGIYDRLEFFWEPAVGRFLTLKVGAVFNFHDDGYSGCSQVVRACFDLHALLNRKKG